MLNCRKADCLVSLFSEKLVGVVSAKGERQPSADSIKNVTAKFVDSLISNDSSKKIGITIYHVFQEILIRDFFSWQGGIRVCDESGVMTIRISFIFYETWPSTREN